MRRSVFCNENIYIFSSLSPQPERSSWIQTSELQTDLDAQLLHQEVKVTGRNQGTISHFEVGAGVRCSLCSVFCLCLLCLLTAAEGRQAQARQQRTSYWYNSVRRLPF